MHCNKYTQCSLTHLSIPRHSVPVPGPYPLTTLVPICWQRWPLCNNNTGPYPLTILILIRWQRWSLSADNTGPYPLTTLALSADNTGRYPLTIQILICWQRWSLSADNTGPYLLTTLVPIRWQHWSWGKTFVNVKAPPLLRLSPV